MRPVEAPLFDCQILAHGKGSRWSRYEEVVLSRADERFATRKGSKVEGNGLRQSRPFCCRSQSSTHLVSVRRAEVHAPREILLQPSGNE